MTRMEWGTVGERFYETGVDRGVLYIAGIPGVPWNGLTAVNEDVTGGEPTPYYFDGIKYANIAQAEEFEATIEAYSAPTEFAQCDGNSEISNGLFITQQPRKAFGFSYRTLIGNDVNGTGAGYKIHLVYNALAAPSSRARSTMGDSIDPMALSWHISTLSPILGGYRPSAHLVIDSRRTSTRMLKDLEDILYGNSFLTPRLPEPSEIRSLFEMPDLKGEWTGTRLQSTSILKNPRTGQTLGTNLAVAPSFELDASASLSNSSVIATNLIPCPSPRKSATGPSGFYTSTGGTLQLQTYGSFAQYSPDPTSTGTVLQTTSTGTSRDVTIQLLSAHYHVPTPGKWYGVLQWLACDSGLPTADYSLVFQMTFLNPAGNRYVTSAVEPSSAVFYSGTKRTLVGQAQSGDTAVFPNPYIRSLAVGSVVPSGKRLWTDAWILVEGSTEAAVRNFLSAGYWDNDTRPSGYNSVSTGVAHQSSIALVPEGVSALSVPRSREVVRASSAAGLGSINNVQASKPLNGMGLKSSCLIPVGGGVNATYLDVGNWQSTEVTNGSPPIQPNRKYRASMSFNIIRAQTPMDASTLHAAARRLEVFKNSTGVSISSLSFPNVPGTYRLEVQFETDSTWTSVKFRATNGSDNPLDIMYIDDFLLEDITDGIVTDIYYDGDTVYTGGILSLTTTV